MVMRHKALHFRPETDTNDRALALEAITCLQEIIGNQFSGFGAQPWFITGVPGEIYIKKEWEGRPFIQMVYLSNGLPVGPKNKIKSLVPRLEVGDAHDYDESRVISDEEFVEQRLAFNHGRERD